MGVVRGWGRKRIWGECSSRLAVGAGGGGIFPGLKIDFYKALHRSMWDGLFQQSSCDMVSGSKKCQTRRGLEIIISIPGWVWPL